MKRKILFLLLWGMTGLAATAQPVPAKLADAFRQFEADPQLRSASTSLYVVDAVTGKVLFGKGEKVGLAPASTQKVITSVTAYELLGKDFRYKTELGYDGAIGKDGTLSGNMYIIGSGDPTLGSWRWKETRDTVVLNRWVKTMRAHNIKSMEGKLVADDSRFGSNPVPDGWIWQDIGNYYGAGAWGLNWKENQFDIILASGDRIGDPVKIIHNDLTDDYREESVFVRNELKAAAKGTGDNAYIYSTPQAALSVLYLRGTIPVGEKRFSISGSVPNPPRRLLQDVYKSMRAGGDSTTLFTGKVWSDINGQDHKAGAGIKIIATHHSPPLDSIIYWFNRRSINLYGEALLKTMAWKAGAAGTTDEGVTAVQEFWKGRGIDGTELNIVDGSGLSPLNRVTTRAQVAVLQHARKQPWFGSFYHALPEYNGMKMKSGTIKGVKGFAGYHRAGDGRQYTFSFLVNNYNGSASSLVQKMYRVLDVLK